MLNIKCLYSGYGELEVLKGINISVGERQIVALIGPNGAGKTTIVKLICKLYQVNEGNILINNKSLADLNIADWHRNLGVLFQD